MNLKKLENLPQSRKRLLLFLVLVFGLFIRLFFTRFGNSSGDVLVFAEWGERFWKLSLHDFYTDRNWYYSFPTYPPLSNLMYGGLSWLNEHRYILAEIHNKTKLIPSFFISFFGEVDPKNPFRWNNGYFMLLKLPVILADLGIGIIIYKIVAEIKRSLKKSFCALIFFVFNPLTIFLSSVWGQSESLIAFFGFISFYLLYKKKLAFSIPMLFVSLYLKPNWIIFTPLYLYLLYLIKPKMKNVCIGLIVSIVLFILTTYPFSGVNLVGFLKDTVISNMLPASKGTQKLTISAFNIYSIFTKTDSVSAETKIIFPLSYWGWMIFLYLNILVFQKLRIKKVSIERLLLSIFTIGMGAFLFLTGMLERYFFSAFPAIVILVFTENKNLIWGVLINTILFMNLIWAFYRRSINGISNIFEVYSGITIRTLSFLNLLCFLKFIMQKYLGKNK